ncbi:MAG: hypothetical protein RQ715_01225 [Methylococcales bacterium]|nr:hypothetical protein [Methylococcales bacterium]
MKKYTLPLLISASLGAGHAVADVGLGVFVSDPAIQLGTAAPKLSISANNTQTAQVRDIHIGVIGPDNRIYEFPDWNTELRPWLSGFTIPANFNLDNISITAFENFPGGLTAGVWQPFIALTNPGTQVALLYK